MRKRTPEEVRRYLDDDVFKLYQLIWQRFVASQMNPAIYDMTIVDFDRLPDGLLGITCRGQGRFRVRRAWRADSGLNIGDVDDLSPLPRTAIPAELQWLAEILERVMPELGADYAALEADYADAGWVGSRLAEVLAMETIERQGLLEIDDPVERLRRLVPHIRAAE